MPHNKNSKHKQISFIRKIMVNHKDFWLLAFLLIIAFSLRLYKYDAPIADWHSWRQADTAAVARNYARNGIDLLYPRFDDISNIQSGIYNPQGYRFVEFPLYNAAIAFLYTNVPIVSLESYGRLINVFMSLVLMSILYYCALKEIGRLSAFISTLVFATFPFFVYYSRVVLPEMTALTLMFISIIITYVLCTARNIPRYFFIMLLLISAIFSSASILVKPMTIFYLLPIAYLYLKKFRFSLVKKPYMYIFLFMSLVPFVLWRRWISQFPEGIPLYQWLLTSVNTSNGLERIFFRPSFFRWIFHERILNLILGGYAACLVIIGIFTKPFKSAFINSIAVSALLYLLVFQGGNLQHDYYQVLILPALALFVGIGAQTLIHIQKNTVSKSIAFLGILFILTFSLLMSFYKVRDYYHNDVNTLRAAKIIQTLTDPNDLIVTDTLGDTTLLYLADRKGYPTVTKTLEEIKKDGISYFVTSKKDVIDDVKKIYPAVFESDTLYIFSL